MNSNSDRSRISRHGRREFMRGAAAGLAAPWLLRTRDALAQGTQQPKSEPAPAASPGLILRERLPENLEGPFSALDGVITPTERFYVRSHFAVPEIDVRAWRLRVEGAVRRPVEFGYAELLRLPSRTVTATLECAGNGRGYLTPSVAGVQWALGAVGTAEWTGVPLRTVLQEAGVRNSAVEVALEGADEGELRLDPKPAGKVPFARSLPWRKVRQPDVLLAYRMNGKELSPAHGFPVRGLVPGWYAVASVKWLTRLIVMDEPFTGHYQTIDYAYYTRRDGMPVRVPVGELDVKAEIARPALQEVVPAGAPYRVFGAAWTGEAEVAKVEVSVDGGRSWAAANLLARPTPNAWRLWEYPWQVPARAGRVSLMARATDSRGRTQPLERDRDRVNYMISHVLPVEVEVRSE